MSEPDEIDTILNSLCLAEITELGGESALDKVEIIGQERAKAKLLAIKSKWETAARIDEIERADSIYNEENIPLWQYFNDRINQLTNEDK